MLRDTVEVACGVHVCTSRREVTTSTLVELGGRVLLVDPAWDPDELDGIADLLDARAWDVAFGVATHAHHDHLLWSNRFGDAPRFASVRTVELSGLVGLVRPAPAVLTLADEPVELLVHDAHAPGHTAVWLPERRVLLAGDMLSDVELPLPFEPDDLPAYLAGLETLAPYVARAEVLVPGHGRPSERPVERLDADRRYLDALLAGEDPDEPRRATPGMAEVHERLMAMVRAGSTPR